MKFFKKKIFKRLVIFLSVFSLLFIFSFKEKFLPLHSFVCKIEQNSIFYNKKIFFFKPINNFFSSYCYDLLKVEKNNDYYSQKKPTKKVLKEEEYKIYSVKKPIIRDNNDWFRSHKNYASNKYVFFDQINKDNIKNLKEVWAYDLGPIKKNKNVEANPVFFKDKLYFPNLKNEIICLDAATGLEVWKVKFRSNRLAYRGLQIDLFKGKYSLYVSSFRGVHVLDLKTGKKIFKFKKTKSILPPVITNTSVIVSSFSELMSFDKKTGALKWKISMQKNRRERGSSVWGGLSYDPKRNLVILPVGSPRFINDFVGINRPGNNLYSNSIVAVNAQNGKIEWYFQDTIHDLWDLDFSFPPILTNIKFEGLYFDVAIAASKSGKIFILELTSGKNLFDYKFIEVKKSSIPGENVSKFQIETIFPPSLMSQEIKENELSQITGEINEFVKSKFKKMESGNYLPPKINEDILARGVSGGAQWMGGSVDPNGILYLPINYIPWTIRIETLIKNRDILSEIDLKEYKLTDNKKDIILRHKVDFFLDQFENFGTNPPWGSIFAIDLQNKKILWERPLGKSIVKVGKKEFKEVDGSDTWGGIIVTKTNLIISSGSDDAKLYFYDTVTGKEIHSIQMDYIGSSSPISYMSNGEQYISVVASGGGRKIGTGNKIYGYKLNK